MRGILLCCVAAYLNAKQILEYSDFVASTANVEAECNACTSVPGSLSDPWPIFQCLSRVIESCQYSAKITISGEGSDYYNCPTSTGFAATEFLTGIGGEVVTIGGWARLQLEPKPDPEKECVYSLSSYVASCAVPPGSANTAVTMKVDADGRVQLPLAVLWPVQYANLVLAKGSDPESCGEKISSIAYNATAIVALTGFCETLGQKSVNSRNSPNYQCHVPAGEGDPGGSEENDPEASLIWSYRDLSASTPTCFEAPECSRLVALASIELVDLLDCQLTAPPYCEFSVGAALAGRFTDVCTDTFGFRFFSRPIKGSWYAGGTGLIAFIFLTPVPIHCYVVFWDTPDPLCDFIDSSENAPVNSQKYPVYQLDTTLLVTVQSLFSMLQSENNVIGQAIDDEGQVLTVPLGLRGMAIDAQFELRFNGGLKEFSEAAVSNGASHRLSPLFLSYVAVSLFCR
eukprot:Gregarina_sp_Poly_1__4394@NODE_2373_length_2214_cov_13_135538_g1513_i0_p1_GENE_NODE_2373_length_2214_cov_13_135538_g1513_i0NODE_2373_length_2214_cov_13_135538_g1513_i0_p1_ORF_typecomplete_len457_score44_06_NODE_2373_length_2214_cov_13_135538_g1513_i02291599